MAEGDDEWTLVMHKRHQRTNRPAQRETHKKWKKKAGTSSKHVHALSTNSNDIVERRDLDKCLKTVKTFRSNWAQSPQGRHLRSLLLAGGHTVSNAIVVGLGNVDPNSIRDPFRATWQLAVFLEVIRALVEKHDEQTDATSDAQYQSSQLPLLAQDPAFTKFDEALLSSLNIEVQQDAMQTCDSETLLFVPFVDAVVLLPQILKGKDPELYIGTDVRLIVEKMSMPTYAQMGDIPQSLVDESLIIANTFLKSRKRLSVDFNGFGELSLYGLSMYGRTPTGPNDTG